MSTFTRVFFQEVFILLRQYRMWALLPPTPSLSSAALQFLSRQALLWTLRDADNESVSLELGDAVAVGDVTPALSVALACSQCRASEKPGGSGPAPRAASALCENTPAEFRIRVTLPANYNHTHTHTLLVFVLTALQHLVFTFGFVSVCCSQVPQARCSEEIQAQNGGH